MYSHFSKRHLHILLCFALVSFAMASACNRSVDPDAMLAAASDNNVKRVSRMYTVFQMRNSMIGPKDEAELKDFILQHSKVRLARIGIDPDEIEQLFSSERDGEKLIIRYGLELKGTNMSSPVVFEAEGQNGIRHIGFANAYMRKVEDSEEYERLLSGEEDNKVFDDDPA